MQITSPKNPLLQEIRRAAHSGRPTESGCIVLEGPHLLAEVLRSQWSLVQVFATTEAIARYATLFPANGRLVETSSNALASVATTETTQGILALARPATCQIGDMVIPHSLVLVLDGIQDPGNAGTLVRSAEAFGATGVVLCQGSVHIANGKFLRATAGSVFRLPILEGMASGEVLSSLHRAGLQVYSLEARAPLTLDQADLRLPCAIVIGNEGAGVSTPFRGRAVSLGIPIAQVESLNAAIAGSIVLYETARQRGAA